MNRSSPRLVIAALRGGAGKTMVSVAVAVALRKKSISVIPFKKGPDYIDAAWLALAASSPCYNLDTFLMGTKQVVRSFSRHAPLGDISLIEGNRGLYDGVNAEGQFSTAELAKLLHAPVILVVDCDKVTRTAAAMTLGCCHLDPAVDIRGVILNRVSGARHAAVVTKAIKNYCNLSVFGTIPRMKDLPLTERYLGLIPPQEHGSTAGAVDKIGKIAEDYLDLQGLIEVAKSASPWGIDSFPDISTVNKNDRDTVRIGIIQDTAFQFYYQENLEALKDAGAEIVWINALTDRNLPDVDCLYIGGGFPETQVKALSDNKMFRRSLKNAAENGLPIYAECGGFMYLGESLIVDDQCYEMAGALPVKFGMEKRPQGHGYTELEVDTENPFFTLGTRLRGHEFHYSRILSIEQEEDKTAYRIVRGTGMEGKRDGMIRKNILAGFTHLHALGTPEWAEALINAGRRWKVARQTDTTYSPQKKSDSARL